MFVVRRGAGAPEAMSVDAERRGTARLARYLTLTFSAALVAGVLAAWQPACRYWSRRPRS